jgi:DUF1680 family protein
MEMRPVYRYPRDYAYHQADCPLVEATEFRGHAVRAMYYMTAATDLVRLTEHNGIHSSLLRLWRDMVDTKMYITGGLGAIRQWEGFGPAYFLGDTEEGGVCYAETCAAFGLIVWCERMLRLRLNSEYADVMELALYNGFLGAVGLDGESFYYENPLQTYTNHGKERSRWFEIACCPPNVAKLLGNLGAFVFSMQDDVVAVHLYIESTLRVPGTDAVVSIKSKAPWSGEVKISWTGSVALCLRIPGWARGYESSVTGQVRDGYLYLPRAADGNVQVVFHMEPRLFYANVKTGKNQVCIMRGPLVYCIEDVDNNNDVDNIALSSASIRDGKPLKVLADEVIPVVARGRELKNRNSTKLYDDHPWEENDEKDLVFIPYYARANRGGKGGMRVWCFKAQA